MIAGIAPLLLVGGLAGCGGSSMSAANGASGTQAQNYKLTVTATSGALSQSTTLNLMVQ